MYPSPLSPPSSLWSFGSFRASLLVIVFLTLVLRELRQAGLMPSSGPWWLVDLASLIVFGALSLTLQRLYAWWINRRSAHSPSQG